MKNFFDKFLGIIFENNTFNFETFQQFETEVRKLDDEEAPSVRDLENTDSVIREIDDKLSQI